MKSAYNVVDLSDNSSFNALDTPSFRDLFVDSILLRRSGRIEFQMTECSWLSLRHAVSYGDPLNGKSTRKLYVP